MRFFKKNPEVLSKAICVNGKMVNNDTVLCGDEFIKFANPSTFPGKPPRLVEVSFDSLSDGERGQAKIFADERVGRPPRSLGVVKSKDFFVQEDGSIDIPSSPSSSSDKGRSRNLPLQTEVPPKKTIPKLSEAYSEIGLIEAFPGITDRNSKEILSRFETVKDLAGASNARLRKAGVQPNFFERIRKKATSEYNNAKKALE